MPGGILEITLDNLVFGVDLQRLLETGGGIEKIFVEIQFEPFLKMWVRFLFELP